MASKNHKLSKQSWVNKGGGSQSSIKGKKSSLQLGKGSSSSSEVFVPSVRHSLQDMFFGVFDQEIIDAVGQSCGWEMERSIETLIALSGESEVKKTFKACGTQKSKPRITGSNSARQHTTPPKKSITSVHVLPKKKTFENQGRIKEERRNVDKGGIKSKREIIANSAHSTLPEDHRMIKVAYKQYGENSDGDDADVVIEEENEFEIVGNDNSLSMNSGSVCQFLSAEIPYNIAVKSSKCIEPAENHSDTSNTSLKESNVKARNHVSLASAKMLYNTVEPLTVVERIQRLVFSGVKVLVLMRGCSGSGKTYLARKIINDTVGGNVKKYIFSTDDYFVRDGAVYTFISELLPEGHAWNQNRVFMEARRGTNPIIVDNTNLEVWEMKPYAKMAVNHGYILELLESDTPWRYNPKELARLNVHGIPYKKIEIMLNRFERNLTNRKLLALLNLRYSPANKPPQPAAKPPPVQRRHMFAKDGTVTSVSTKNNTKREQPRQHIFLRERQLKSDFKAQYKSHLIKEPSNKVKEGMHLCLSKCRQSFLSEVEKEEKGKAAINSSDLSSVELPLFGGRQEYHHLTESNKNMKSFNTPSSPSTLPTNDDTSTEEDGIETIESHCHGVDMKRIHKASCRSVPEISSHGMKMQEETCQSEKLKCQSPSLAVNECEHLYYVLVKNDGTLLPQKSYMKIVHPFNEGNTVLELTSTQKINKERFWEYLLMTDSLDLVIHRDSEHDHTVTKEKNCKPEKNEKFEDEGLRIFPNNASENINQELKELAIDKPSEEIMNVLGTHFEELKVSDNQTETRNVAFIVEDKIEETEEAIHELNTHASVPQTPDILDSFRDRPITVEEIDQWLDQIDPLHISQVPCLKATNVQENSFNLELTYSTSAEVNKRVKSAYNDNLNEVNGNCQNEGLLQITKGNSTDDIIVEESRDDEVNECTEYIATCGVENNDCITLGDHVEKSGSLDKLRSFQEQIFDMNDRSCNDSKSIEVSCQDTTSSVDDTFESISSVSLTVEENVSESETRNSDSNCTVPALPLQNEDAVSENDAANISSEGAFQFHFMPHDVKQMLHDVGKDVHYATADGSEVTGSQNRCSSTSSFVSERRQMGLAPEGDGEKVASPNFIAQHFLHKLISESLSTNDCKCLESSDMKKGCSDGILGKGSEKNMESLCTESVASPMDLKLQDSLQTVPKDIKRLLLFRSDFEETFESTTSEMCGPKLDAQENFNVQDYFGKSMHLNHVDNERSEDIHLGACSLHSQQIEMNTDDLESRQDTIINEDHSRIPYSDADSKDHEVSLSATDGSPIDVTQHTNHGTQVHSIEAPSTADCSPLLQTCNVAKDKMKQLYDEENYSSTNSGEKCLTQCLLNAELLKNWEEGKAWDEDHCKIDMPEGSMESDSEPKLARDCRSRTLKSLEETNEFKTITPEARSWSPVSEPNISWDDGEEKNISNTENKKPCSPQPQRLFFSGHALKSKDIDTAFCNAEKNNVHASGITGDTTENMVIQEKRPTIDSKNEDIPEYKGKDTNELPKTKTYSTNTHHSDFRLLNDVNSGSHIDPDSDVRVIHAFNRNIIESLKLSSPSLPKVSCVLKLDKSSMTDDFDAPIYEPEAAKYHYNELAQIFPHISKDDLKEIYERCNGDINWTVDLLLDSKLEGLPHQFSFTVNPNTSNNDLLPSDSDGVGCSHVSNKIGYESLAQNNSATNLALMDSPAVLEVERKQQTSMKRNGKKDRKAATSEMSAYLKKKWEESFVISSDHYSENVLRIRQLNHADSLNTWESDVNNFMQEETEPNEIEDGFNFHTDKCEAAVDIDYMNTCDKEGNKNDVIMEGQANVSNVNDNLSTEGFGEGADIDCSLEEEEQVTVPLTLDRAFVSCLKQLFGSSGPLFYEDADPVVNIPLSLARQIHYYLMESQQNSYDAMIREDEELARQLQEQDETVSPHPPKVPDMQEIMDMEMALAVYKTDENQWHTETKDNLATKLSKQLLCETFPCLAKDVLMDVFHAHNYSFLETLEVLLASTSQETHEEIMTVMSPEACAAHEKVLLEKASVETQKNNEGKESEKATKQLSFEDSEFYRSEARRHYELRKEYLRKANEAFHKGATGVASYYSQMAGLHKMRMEDANAQVASSLLMGYSIGHLTSTLDLHFLYVTEAIIVLNIFLDRHVKRLQSVGRKQQAVFIITGRGVRSFGGRSRIKPAVENQLDSRGIRYVEVNPGLLKAFVNRSTLSSDISQ